MALQVLVEEKYSTRIFTLNRPNQLNAVSFPMVQFSWSLLAHVLLSELEWRPFIFMSIV